MVVGAFPAAKLGLLALRQISKPIANVLKERAKQHPFFRQYVCMPPAHFYNWVEVKVKMWAMNLGKPAHIPKLNEAMAIELGANLLGEIIMFVFASGVLLVEYNRQSKKEQEKVETLEREKRELEEAIAELGFAVEKHEAQIKHLTRVTYDLDSKAWFKSSKVEIMDENQNSAPLSFKKFVGNYNPDRGIVFKALNMIENELL